MALALVRAAEASGIALTLLPALYAYGDFGETPLRPAQKRFATQPADVLRIIESMRASHPGVRCGVAPHSLRAVSPPMLKDLLAGLNAIDNTAPIHIHVAEQVKEVNDCLTWSDQCPVQSTSDGLKFLTGRPASAPIPHGCSLWRSEHEFNNIIR